MTVEEMIKNSQCFGIAYDAHVPECRTCDVKTKCDAKCRSNWDSIVSRPAPTIVAEVSEITTKPDFKVIQSNKPAPAPTPKVEKKVKQPEKTVKAAVTAKNYSKDMPEFKGLTIEQLENMAVKRGANLADFEKFKAVNIRRMRLTMFLKKSYEV